MGVGVELELAEEDRLIKEKWGAGHRKQLEHLLQNRPELVDKAVESTRSIFLAIPLLIA